MRKLTLASGNWRWEAGIVNIVIKSPGNVKTIVSKLELSGFTPDELDRRASKGVAFQFTPALIKEYIEKNLIE